LPDGGKTGFLHGKNRTGKTFLTAKIVFWQDCHQNVHLLNFSNVFKTVFFLMPSG